MRFTKMQGAGNDYIYVDCFQQKPPKNPAALSKAMSDRHYGVGGDGLILICPSERADARMRMFNADGSEAEMCGNGIRCVAKYVYERGIAKKSPLTIETGAGVLTLELQIADAKVNRVKVDMGAPILEAENIPTTLSGPRIIDRSIQDEPDMNDIGLHLGKAIDPRITCVSMGNPHAVLYLTGGNLNDVKLDDIGPMIENAAVFPKRTNVHFVRLESKTEVSMRAWERGSGETLACGTGACAVAVAGVLTGRTDRKITAHLPGGELQLHWCETDNHVYMTGPAVEVFRGEWANDECSEPVA